MMKELVYLSAIFTYSLANIITFVIGAEKSTVVRGLPMILLSIAVCRFLLTKSIYLTTKQKNIKVISITLYALILFWMLVYAFVFNSGDLPSRAQANLFAYGTRVIYSILFAIVAVERREVKSIIKAIEPFCLFFSIVLIIVVQKNVGMRAILMEIDRQTASYAAAYSFSLLFFINYNFELLKKEQLIVNPKWKLINIFIMIANVYTIFAGGGRGALVLVVVVSFFYLLCSTQQLTIKRFILLFLIAGSVMVGLYKLPQISAISSGSNSIINFFSHGISTDMSASQRVDIYQNSFQLAKDSYFLGYGAGSTGFLMPIYSHNIFLDVLVEYGLIGVIILFVLVIKVQIIGWKKRDNLEIQLCWIFFTCGFVLLMFSGSLYGETAFWFSMVSIFMLNVEKKVK